MKPLYLFTMLCAACGVRADPIIANPALKDASPALSAIVIAQCRSVVAIYITTVGGKLIRYDDGTNIPLKDLLVVVDTAKSQEVINLACPS